MDDCIKDGIQDEWNSSTAADIFTLRCFTFAECDRLHGLKCVFVMCH